MQTRCLISVDRYRKQHPILPNIYEEASEATPPNAQITISDGTQRETTFELHGPHDKSDLKRISVFDSAVAQTHLTEQGPLGFKPAGFDVFPEMARVYGQIMLRLMAEIERRTRRNIFVKSFVGAQTEVSKFVAELDATTNIEDLCALAVFGLREEARLKEVERLKKDLDTQSVPETIKQLDAAKGCIEALQRRLEEAAGLVSDRKRKTYAAQLNDFKAKARVLRESGSESFKHPALKGIGTAEWERFLGAARDLAAVEDADYPRDEDHCLMCHRPLVH